MNDNCQQYALLLSTYFDRELKGRQAQLLEVHLQKCADCRETLSTYNTIRRGLIAMATRTGTERSLARDIMASLEGDDEPPPC